MLNTFTIIAFAFLGFMLYRRFSLVFNKNVKNLSAKEAHEFIKKDKSIIVIDVRTKGEYKNGHIARAKSFPVNEIALRINELEKFKDRPIIVHCASGNRSPLAVKTLLKSGFINVYHMNHGLLGWKYGMK